MSELIFLGVDLGLSGALVFLEGARVETLPMPTLKSGKSREVYDLAGLLAILRGRCPSFAVAEQLHAMPASMGGSGANFSRGYVLGTFQALFAALGVAHELVPPRTWQKVMHAGVAGDDTKQRSIVACQRLFPNVDLRRTERCRKPDDGIADALLLAEFARRRRGGV